MKSVIAAVAIALATPVLAAKQPVKPVHNECSVEVAHLQQQILLLKKQLRMAEAQKNRDKK